MIHNQTYTIYHIYKIQYMIRPITSSCFLFYLPQKTSTGFYHARPALSRATSRLVAHPSIDWAQLGGPLVVGPSSRSVGRSTASSGWWIKLLKRSLSCEESHSHPTKKQINILMCRNFRPKILSRKVWDTRGTVVTAQVQAVSKHAQLLPNRVIDISM